MDDRALFVTAKRPRMLLRASIEAARGGDTARMVSLLYDDVVRHGDAGQCVGHQTAIGGREAVANSHCVTRTLAGRDREENDLKTARRDLSLKANGPPSSPS